MQRDSIDGLHNWRDWQRSRRHGKVHLDVLGEHAEIVVVHVGLFSVWGDLSPDLVARDMMNGQTPHVAAC